MPSAVSAPAEQLLFVPGGSFVMGDATGEPDERPRKVSVDGFLIMRTEVTNGDFAAYVALSGRTTDAERRGFGYVWTGRWDRVPGASWRRPFGPDSDIAGREDHPVLQTSARDAAAFCAFHGMRLPSEQEWEFAARGPESRRYPWSASADDARLVDESGARLANFGTVACCAPDSSDGYARTAPIGSYPGGASPFGLLDMAGNVWEWTLSPFPGRPQERVLRGGGWGNNPYCLRSSYRHGNPPDIGLDMVGFRCARDP